MRSILCLAAAAAAVCLLVTGPQAGAADPVTLKGEVMCGKCELKETPKCATVIRVKEGGKEVTYYFLDKGTGEEYHEAVCGGGRKEAAVTGTVTEKEGKKYITPTKVEYAKK
jgi:hypothetical protein